MHHERLRLEGPDDLHRLAVDFCEDGAQGGLPLQDVVHGRLQAWRVHRGGDEMLGAQMVGDVVGLELVQEP